MNPGFLSSSPIKKRLKRQRFHISPNNSNDSIYSCFDKIREKDEEIDHKEAQIIKYENDMEKLKAENKELQVKIAQVYAIVNY